MTENDSPDSDRSLVTDKIALACTSFAVCLIMGFLASLVGMSIAAVVRFTCNILSLDVNLDWLQYVPVVFACASFLIYSRCVSALSIIGKSN